MNFGDYRLETLREDAELLFCRAFRGDDADTLLVVGPAVGGGTPSLIDTLRHELDLAAELDPLWALLPVAISDLSGWPVLIRADPGGRPLEIDPPRPGAQRFLHTAIGVATALRHLHARGIIHHDLRPANIFVGGNGDVRLTGFGLASRLARERQTTARPGTFAGTLGYMAPEQSGRLNRSIDHRSDLYSMGVTFYEMLVGALPFAASTPVEWVYSHVAREPPPPSVRVEGIPGSIEQIVLKLLAKNPEDRYQTAAGVEHDLRRCLADQEAVGKIAAFTLGTRDIPTHFIMPEKLYGRDEEVRALVETFRNVSEHRSFDFVLVSGEPGIGKSSIVGELRRVVYGVGGLFASGKFDQYKRNVPYATIAEAFRGLLRQLLGLDDASLETWRAEIQSALGVNGKIMIEIFPELQLVIGEQPEVLALSPPESRNRFNLMLLRLIGVFASPDHPLVLFLDDLQWLDEATLELIELMAGEEQIPNLLLLGAFRRNEVTQDHRLAAAIHRIAETRGGVQEIRLEVLRKSEVATLVRDALHASGDEGDKLGGIVFEKARGNPFFTVQFLRTLSADGLIWFDQKAGTWQWDAGAIQRRGITENVAALLGERLGRYEGPTRDVAMQLACLGDHGSGATLAALLGVRIADIDRAMRELVADGLVQRVDRHFVFAHDGVREAAYALVPEEDRPRIHRAIGEYLLGQAQGAEVEEDIFAIVDHLNRGIGLIKRRSERLQLARLNLLAGTRSKAGAAYGPAIGYLTCGLGLLGQSRTPYRLRFELEFDLADSEFMTGLVEDAERRFASLSERSRDIHDRSRVVDRQLSLYFFLGQTSLGVELSLGCLAEMGVELPIHPTQEDIEAEYNRLLERLGGRSFAHLAELPRMTNPRQLKIVSTISALFSPAGTTNPSLHYLAALRMANLAAEFGNSDEVPHSYANIAGMVLGWHVGTFADAKNLADVALRLVDEKGYDRHASRVYASIAGTSGAWSRPLSDCYTIAIKATEIGREQGGVTYAAYAWGVALTSLLDSGRSLAEVERQAEGSLAIVAKLKFPIVTDFITAQLMLARALRGQTDHLTSLSGGGFDEPAYEERLEAAPHLWHALVRYRIRKLQLNFIAGEVDCAVRLLPWLDQEVDQLKVFELVEFHFYAALTRAAALRRSPGDSLLHRPALERSSRKLAAWGETCPENFACRVELVAAELASIDGRTLEAAALYESAIRLAQEHGFQQVEALAGELAAAASASHGLSIASALYLDRARGCYERWGATAKAALLDRKPAAPAPSAVPRAAADSSAQLQQLDLAAAVDMYQSLSREIDLDRLIERLMVTVVEHAGARRGLLLLSREGRLRIVAEAATTGEEVQVSFRRPAHFSGELPESILNYASRTREVIIIDDALEANAHSGDAYILRARPRSILCLPLVKQGRLVGMLYLENEIASHIFTQDRVAVLQMAASQAAISIENAELFLNVREKQEEVRRAGDEVRRSFDMIPALAWSASAEGMLEFSNKQWHDFTGIQEQDARGGSWICAFHPDDLAKVTDKWLNLQRFRSSGEFEARMRRFDGTYRRFLTRLTPMCDAAGDVIKWHGTNTDIDDLKRAEEAQEALARASRISAMGALTVSIAHEINQPLMAIVTNAATCIRWLDAQSPNLVEARLAAERVIRDGHRAGDVISSIRAMARKAGHGGSELIIADLVREVLDLTHNELERHSIRVDTRVAADVRPVRGDRVQIQQVLLNLIVNGIEAIAAAPGGARSLVISARLGEPGFTTIAVADTGVGFADTEPDRIFDAFYTTKDEGVGIGLSICRSIIETHGGRIWAAGRVPRGSIFQFSLPQINGVTAP